MHIELDYTPYDHQLELHKDLSRFRIVAGGRRVGKTKCCTQEVIKHCLETPKALVFWVAPTFRDAREVGFEEFLAYQEQLAPAIKSVHLTQLKVEFVNGSVIYYKGSDNPDSLRGRGLTMLVCDEFAFFKPEVFSLRLRPALSDKQGRALLISTPNGLNEFYDLFNKEGSSWSHYHWITEMNPLITEEELEDVKGDISDIDFRQEYMAEFITRAGRVYDEFGEPNLVDEFIYDKDLHDIYLGMDFGYASKTSVVFMAVDRRTENKVIQFDEIYVSRTQMGAIADLIELKLREWGMSKRTVLSCFTDPAGNAEELSSGLSPVDMLRARDFIVMNKGSNIVPGLAMVRSFVRNVRGEVRFFVTRRCEHTIKSFNGYQYAIKTNGVVKEEAQKDGIYDHLPDAIRYFFVNRFDMAKYVAKTVESKLYTKPSHTKVMKKCDMCKKPFISITPKGEAPFACGACRND